MSIKENIRQKMYASMKAGNKEDKTIYSMLLDSIQKAEKTAQKEFTDDEVVPVVQKQVKQCKETLEFAQKATNSIVSIGSIQHEIAILESFLPQMMSEDEIKMFVDGLKDEFEPIKSNKGKYMKACSVLRGKADMKMVAQIVDSILA